MRRCVMTEIVRAVKQQPARTEISFPPFPQTIAFLLVSFHLDEIIENDLFLCFRFSVRRKLINNSPRHLLEQLAPERITFISDINILSVM